MIGNYNEFPEIIIGEGVIQNDVIVVPYGISVENLNIRVYPNPASHFLNITSDLEIEGYKVHVFDLTGVLALSVKSNQLQSGKIDISGLAIGTYMLQILNQQDQPLKQFKILKTH